MATSMNQLGQQSVFEGLQRKIDEEIKIRDQIRDIVHTLEKEVKIVLSILTNAYSQNATAINEHLHEKILTPAIEQIKILSRVMSHQSCYKFNGHWQQQMQDASFAVLLFGWLGGYGVRFEGKLVDLEAVGEKLDTSFSNTTVSVNTKGGDNFHLTIEEYLQSVISLVDELARIARNSVILGNYERPLLISQFIKELHTGFQLLNLRNSNLRKRSDGIKYRIREVEDIVYDLSLRNLLPK